MGRTQLTTARLGYLLIHSLTNDNREHGKGLGGLLTAQSGANYRTGMHKVLREVMQTLGIAEGVLAHLALFCREAAIRRLIVVPCGPFGLLPLHAALIPATPHGNMALFIDIVQINYAPSAQIWAVCRKRARTFEAQREVTALVVADPQPQEPEVRPLHQAREEGSALIALLTDQEDRVFSFVGKSATFLNVLKGLKAQMDALTHVHFACHGMVDLADPQSSGLLLAYGARLMIRHLFAPAPIHLTQLRLVVLSACQTALSGLELPDEVVGLPAGWLQAGAKGVVASLWPISDTMTAAFMKKFYELHLLDRLEPVEALWLAQRWLRQLPTWREDCRTAHAYHAALGPEVSEVLLTSKSPLIRGGLQSGLQDSPALQNQQSTGADRGEGARQRATTSEEYLETARHWAAFVCYGA